jgi:hypothetical protein
MHIFLRLACLRLGYLRYAKRSGRLSRISALACLYTTWRFAGLECERMSMHLERGHFGRSLASFERTCILVTATDALVDIVGHCAADAADAPLITARRRLLVEIEHWLGDARCELSKVATCLCGTGTGNMELDAKIGRLRWLILQTN